jgi:hypothetical protein
MMRRMLAFAFLVLALNFVWEMAQGGLYAGMGAMPFWSATALCLRAAASDLAITAVAFAVAAAAGGGGDWVSGPGRFSRVLFVAVGLAITIALEKRALATGRWQYGERMPVVLGVGLLPIAQWIVLPIVEIAFLLRGKRRRRAGDGRVGS